MSSTENISHLFVTVCLQLMLEYGCTELMFTSDNKQGIDNGGIDGGEDFQFPVFVSIILNFV